MSFSTKPLVAAALLAALGLSATAQTAVPITPAITGVEGAHDRHDPARRAEHHARMQERLAQRQSELKQKLQLSPAQEPAWASFTTAVKPVPRERPDREALARMSTPDRIDQMRALRNARMAEMDRRGEATKAFYATLNADQKKVFDAETLHRGHGHGHGHRGWHKG